MFDFPAEYRDHNTFQGPQVAIGCHFLLELVHPVISLGPLEDEAGRKPEPLGIGLLETAVRRRKGEEQGDNGGAEGKFEWREILAEPEHVGMMVVALRARASNDASPESDGPKIFDDEMVVVFKESRDGHESLMFHDFT